MTRIPLLRQVWAFCVLGLLVRALAGGLLGSRQPIGIGVMAHRVDVNRAGVGELTVLPGVGVAKAEAIVLERIRGGWFRDSADLQRVDGLGPLMTQVFRDMVSFSMPGASAGR